MTEANLDILQVMESTQIFSLSGDSRAQEIISRLKFMSKARQGERINVRDLFVRDNDSVAQRILRTLHNVGTWVTSSETVESRRATLAFIQETLNNAITLVAVYRRERDELKQNIANIIVENLEASKAGIRNMIATYQSDRRFVSEAEAVIQTLEARIANMKVTGMSESSFMPCLDEPIMTGYDDE